MGTQPALEVVGEEARAAANLVVVDLCVTAFDAAGEGAVVPGDPVGLEVRNVGTLVEREVDRDRFEGVGVLPGDRVVAEGGAAPDEETQEGVGLALDERREMSA